METDLRILQIQVFAWFFTPYEFDPATIQGHHIANLLTVRKKERKVYLKQEMKNEETRKRGKFKLLEASFSIIKRTFGNFLHSFQRNIKNGMSFFLPDLCFLTHHSQYYEAVHASSRCSIGRIT